MKTVIPLQRTILLAVLSLILVRLAQAQPSTPIDLSGTWSIFVTGPVPPYSLTDITFFPAEFTSCYLPCSEFSGCTSGEADVSYRPVPFSISLSSTPPIQVQQTESSLSYSFFGPCINPHTVCEETLSGSVSGNFVSLFYRWRILFTSDVGDTTETNLTSTINGWLDLSGTTIAINAVNDPFMQEHHQFTDCHCLDPPDCDNVVVGQTSDWELTLPRSTVRIETDIPISAPSSLDVQITEVGPLDIGPDQETATLDFVVEVSGDGQPVPYAEVLVVVTSGTGAESEFNGTTGADGRFDVSLSIPAPDIGTTKAHATAEFAGTSADTVADLYSAQQIFSEPTTLTPNEVRIFTRAPDLGDIGGFFQVTSLFKSLLELARSFLELFSALSFQDGDAMVVSCHKYEQTNFFIRALWVREGEVIGEIPFWTTDEFSCEILEFRINTDLWRTIIFLNQGADFTTTFPKATSSILYPGVASPAFLFITAPDGSHAGYDPVTQEPVADFPLLASDVGDEPFDIIIPGPTGGQYQIDVVGIGSGAYTLTLETLDSNGNADGNVSYSGFIENGEIQTFFFDPSSPPHTRYVATTGSDSGNDCTNPASPCATLSHAVAQANAGDTIDLAAGTYNEPGLVIDKALTIQGQGVVVQ